MSERTTVDQQPVHLIISKLHCICNLIANFFGYEFHVSVKLDKSKMYEVHIIETEPEEPHMIEQSIIPDNDQIVQFNNVELKDITL